MLEGTEKPAPATPLLKAGLYWPGMESPSVAKIQAACRPDAPVVPLIFYRALVQGAGLNPINRLVKSLTRRGLVPMPIFVASLKDPLSVATLESLFQDAPPSVILNCTAFAVGSPHQGDESPDNPLTMQAANNIPVFQVVLAAGSEEAWKTGTTGLSARDIAMNVALPEVDGRVLSRAVSFKDEAFFDEATECPIATYRAEGTRIEFVADLTAKWAALRAKENQEKQVAWSGQLSKQGWASCQRGRARHPAGHVDILHLLAKEDYTVDTPPADSAALMDQILAGPTNWLTDRSDKDGGVTLPLDAYEVEYKKLPYSLREAIEDRWGPPEDDPFFILDQISSQKAAAEGGFKLSILTFGNVTVGVQPARGYNIDPTDTYHDPDLVPPHNYLAFYFWLRHVQKADAIIHMGKHGNLEWLPGKALSLSEECFPEAVFGPTPHLYPFIVNDPGEGTQAKRRAQAVIIDHLTPPLTRAETYGPLKDLEALVDEYYEAAGVDPRRIKHLREQILSMTAATGLDQDAGMEGQDTDSDLAKLDAYLCDLKEAQIRDGLHVFGASPKGDQRRDLAIALARVPRGKAGAGDASLIRALADDLELDFDPLDTDMSASWAGPRPDALALSEDAWRSAGDTIERLELLAIALLDGRATPPGQASAAVLEMIQTQLLPAVDACGAAEGAGLLTGLAGHFVAPGPSGAPTRGRPDVLPTGRNFFSVDSRAVQHQPLGPWAGNLPGLLIEKHLRISDWPRSLLLSAWEPPTCEPVGMILHSALR